MTEYLNYFDGYIADDMLWFSNLNFNAFIKMNIKTGDTEMVSLFPGFDRDCRNLHCGVIQVGNRLFFTPYRSNTVHIWDMEKETFLPNMKITCEEDIKYVGTGVDRENMLWIVPENLAEPIVVIDAERGKLADSISIKKVLLQEELSADFESGLKNVAFYDNAVYIQGYKQNGLVKIRCADRKIEFYKFAGSYKPVSLDTFDGENFYFFNYPDNRLLKWNIRNGSVEEILPKYQFANGRTPFWGVVKVSEIFLFLPCHSNSICTLDLRTRAMKELQLPEGFRRSSPFALIGHHKIYENKLYLFPRSGNELLVMDTKDFVISEIKYRYPETFAEYSEDVLQTIFLKDFEESNLSESFAYDETLGMFLDKVVTGGASLPSQANNIGGQIHEYVKNRYRMKERI
jgi:WD40 repeat protein